MELPLQAAQQEDHAWCRALYTEHRNAFVKWARQQYQVREEEARDDCPTPVE